MSIASELSRLQQAKSDLATSIAAKGVTVPAATTIDGYAALVDQIQQGGGGGFPFGSEIEYLQGTGTQYINSGITPNADTGIKIYAECANNTDSFPVGLKNTAGDTRWTIGHYKNGFYYGYGGWSDISPLIKVSAAEVCLNFKNNKKFSVSASGSYGEINLPTLSFTPSYNIRLFGRAGDGASTWSGKLYYVQISQGDSIVADFIPVRIGQVGYLYDKVRETLFGNIGTGNFILGADKN